MNGPMKDWDAMGSDWRDQAVPTIDVDALRAEATQQGRRLRRTLVLETLLAFKRAGCSGVLTYHAAHAAMRSEGIDPYNLLAAAA